MKKFISVAVIVISLSISYFFAYFLPQYLKEKEVSKRIMECRKLVDERFEKDKAEVADLPITAGPIIPWAYQAHYNSKLNECICSEESHQGANSYYSLYDLYSNTLLDSYSSGPAIPKTTVNPNIDAFGNFVKENIRGQVGLPLF